ncbi:MAG TPA: hypothetical protein VK898_10250 [Chloroflexota bacterium]|nr:hypothetical protein [Chloroflexota bacterium]
MLQQRPGLLAVAIASLVLLPLGLRSSAPAQERNFDKLPDADRRVLGERFKQQVWPLLARGGKDGCVGCHSTPKGGPALRFSGDPDKDFRMLLRDGFFLKDDGGSLLGRIEESNKKRRMPPGPLPRWTDAEKKPLSDLVDAIDRKQKS